MCIAIGIAIGIGIGIEIGKSIGKAIGKGVCIAIGIGIGIPLWALPDRLPDRNSKFLNFDREVDRDRPFWSSYCCPKFIKLLYLYRLNISLSIDVKFNKKCLRFVCKKCGLKHMVFFLKNIQFSLDFLPYFHCRCLAN